MKFIDQFWKFVNDNQLFSAEDKLIIALSGGVDSVVLAHILAQAGVNMIWAHCNFQLRQSESDQDEEWVRHFAQKHGIPFFSKRFNTDNYADENKESIQEAARNLRYQWFKQLAQEEKCTKILTAHHADDQVETLFINLIRGTGLKGLAGIPLKRKNIVRPLLFATKEEISAYANCNKIVYRYDKSNDDDKYLRNRVRKYLIPALEKTDPNFKSQVLASVSHFRNASEHLSKWVLEAMKKIIRSNDNEEIIDVQKLRHIDSARFLLREYLSALRFNHDVIDQIWKSLDGQSGKKFYANKYILLKDRDQLIIRKRNTLNSEHVQINKIQEIESPIKLTMHEESIQDIITNSNLNQEYFDATKLKFPLTIRKWKHGDKFTPLGMKGSRKLSDFFVDQKFTRFEKDDTWLLLSEGKIAWVIGHRMSDDFKVSPSTSSVIKINVNE